MNITMSELNKKANAIINQVVESNEPVTVIKHGKAIAEIIPIINHKIEEEAAEYLLSTPPTKVDESIESLIQSGRNRGV